MKSSQNTLNCEKSPFTRHEIDRMIYSGPQGGVRNGASESILIKRIRIIN